MRKSAAAIIAGLPWWVLGFTSGYMLAALVAARSWGRLP